MRVEWHNGNWIVCGHIFDVSEIKPGQKWQSSGNNIVEVVSVEDGWVKYKWEPHGEYEKDSFSFQCRYCLIVDEETKEKLE